jgi:hypothetical protein
VNKKLLPFEAEKPIGTGFIDVLDDTEVMYFVVARFLLDNNFDYNFPAFAGVG